MLKDKASQSERAARSQGKSGAFRAVLFGVMLSIITTVSYFNPSPSDAEALSPSASPDALDVAASIPSKHPWARAREARPVPVDASAARARRPIIVEGAASAISSVKGIVGMMRQAQEITAMLPTKDHAAVARRETAKAQPGGRVPERPMAADNAKKNKNDEGLNLALLTASRLPGGKTVKAGPRGNQIGQGSRASLSPVSRQGFIWPVIGNIYSAFKATRGRRMHGAIDIVTKKGTPISAAADGIVSVAVNGGSGRGRRYSGYGKIVIIDHGRGVYTVYAHCDKILVKMGQRVRQGEYIATVGRTGRASADHCHFEIRIAGKKHDPLAYLPSRPELVKMVNYHSPRSKSKARSRRRR